MKIIIFGRHTERSDYETLGRFFRILNEKQVEYAVDAAYAEDLKSRLDNCENWVSPYAYPANGELSQFDYALSFGGDGTFLNSARRIGDAGLPLLGVNFGRLGFLTSLRHEDLHTVVDALSAGAFRTEERVGIRVVSSPEGLFGQHNLGLNDLTIHKTHSNEMITVHTYINGEFLNSYWGDGLIVSTPTGSTAYSLACGGPIIHPSSGVFVITPVAPHSLTIRPIIIPDDKIITFDIESRSSQVMIALDAKTEVVGPKTEIGVQKADYKIKMLRVGTGNYLDTLRNRLRWGEDSRN